jgi:hypothetical protein
MNIIELAKQAGFERLGHTDDDWVCCPKDIKAFAKLVAAHEREECAKLCFSCWNNWLATPEEDCYKVLYDAEDCAAAIRARSNT